MILTIFVYLGVNNGEETTSTKTDFNFRINQNRILILEMALFLNLLPKNKNKVPHKNKFTKNDVKNDDNYKEVEKEAENTQNELKDLLLSGWKMDELLNIVSEKIVKKGTFLSISFFLFFFFSYFIQLHFYFY